jgi:hypothetical protein
MALPVTVHTDQAQESSYHAAVIADLCPPKATDPTMNGRVRCGKGKWDMKYETLHTLGRIKSCRGDQITTCTLLYAKGGLPDHSGSPPMYLCY